MGLQFFFWYLWKIIFHYYKRCCLFWFATQPIHARRRLQTIDQPVTIEVRLDDNAGSLFFLRRKQGDNSGQIVGQVFLRWYRVLLIRYRYHAVVREHVHSAMFPLRSPVPVAGSQTCSRPAASSLALHGSRMGRDAINEWARATSRVRKQAAVMVLDGKRRVAALWNPLVP